MVEITHVGNSLLTCWRVSLINVMRNTSENSCWGPNKNKRTSFWFVGFFGNIVIRWLLILHLFAHLQYYIKLIRRWDSERELSLRRHRASTTKYNRLVHKFRHRSTRLCVGTHVFTKFSEITQYNGVQGHSRSPILVPIESSYTTS